MHPKAFHLTLAVHNFTGFLTGARIFILSTVPRLALVPTQPLIKRITEAVSLGVKQVGHEADNKPPRSAMVKNT